jgi:hypothetical protein
MGKIINWKDVRVGGEYLIDGQYFKVEGIDFDPSSYMVAWSGDDFTYIADANIIEEIAPPEKEEVQKVEREIVRLEPKDKIILQPFDVLENPYGVTLIYLGEIGSQILTIDFDDNDIDVGWKKDELENRIEEGSLTFLGNVKKMIVE